MSDVRDGFAIKPGNTPNPIIVVAAGQPIPEGGYRDTTDGSHRIEDAFGNLLGTTNLDMGDYSRPDPAPANTDVGTAFLWGVGVFADFNAEDPTPLPGTREHGWFRVYREEPRDHNRVDDLGYDDPFYDTSNLNQGTHPNASVFVVTCGSGATAACKDYGEANSLSPNAFLDPADFTIIRGAERMYWYRIEWSPFLGDNREFAAYYEYEMANGTISPSGGWSRNMYKEVVAGHFGSIRWIQRLDREAAQVVTAGDHTSNSMATPARTATAFQPSARAPRPSEAMRCARRPSASSSSSLAPPRST